MRYILCLLFAFICFHVTYFSAASPVLLMKDYPYSSNYKRHVTSTNASVQDGMSKLQKRQNGTGYGAAIVR